MSFFRHHQDKFSLNHNNYQLNKLYNTLEKDDTSEAVFAALDVLRKTKTMPTYKKSVKSEELSHPCRLTGNMLFRNGDYKAALGMYNLAIGCAPKGSQCLVLAYSNRSALLQRIKAYSAALEDIKTCLTMNCTPDIKKKLKLRQDECKLKVLEENSLKEEYRPSKEIFDLPSKRHPQIPSVSASVDVVFENGLPKVVAKEEISIGTIVGIETAFVSSLESDTFNTACHYCHKFMFNLIACDNCCETFFCSNECKDKCNQEYHKIECHIDEVVKEICNDDYPKLTLIAFLKLKSMTKTWEELISAASKSLNKPEHGSVRELYDVNSIHSILNMSDKKKHFLYGQKYNFSLIVAILMHHLEKIPGFFPASRELRKEALQTFSRIMMHLLRLKHKLVFIQHLALNYPNMELGCEIEASEGLFPFTGKLKHDCEPNLLVLGLDNRVVLVAIKNILPGTELTISYLGHYYDRKYMESRASKLLYIKPGCQCRVCVDNWCYDNVEDAVNTVSQTQKNFFTEWFMRRVLDNCICNTKMAKNYLSDIVKGLAIMEDKPHSKQYLLLYEEFRRLLGQWQYAMVDHAYVML